MSRMRARSCKAAFFVVLATLCLRFPGAQAQTFTILHNFTGGGDGSEPLAGLVMDRAGNLYGTTSGGNTLYNGNVFKLHNSGTGWIFTPIYQFAGGTDGSVPSAGVLIGNDGSLYGTTYFGGDPNCEGGNCGTVFKLSPPLRICQRASCPWTKTEVYAFTDNGNEGANPGGGSLVEDAQRNLYGTTSYGGSQNCITGCGVVFELLPNGSHWTEKILYRFNGGTDGSGPYSGVTFDSPTVMFGTTTNGGDPNCYAGCGTVYQLALSGSTWTETVLYPLHGPNPDGAYPYAGVIEDQSGNLYGATTSNGGGGGTVFELSRLAHGSPSNWAFNLLYSFPGYPEGPLGNLAFDSHGNLYGASSSGGAHNQGAVFKLSPNGDGTWTYTSLHDFTGGSDGGGPWGNMLVDAAGNVYGTTENGGSHYHGVVWMITP